MAADTNPIGVLGTQEFERLYALHASRIYRYAVRRLGPSLAEDICAQTFVTAWERRAQFDSTRGTASAWLFGIATNLIRRHNRTEARQMRAYARTGQDPAASDAILAVISRVDAHARWPRIAAALADLRQDERDLLWLQATAELSYPEIAAILEIPVGTVRSRLSRLKEKVELACGDTPRAVAPRSVAGDQ